VEAVPALIQALSDSESTVRAPAADALGTIGPAAKQAVRALSERLLVSGEVIYVLRSDASALGNIGADAVSALPALREVLKITRVTATAEEAILKINRQPVPSWY
jgi:HEAT repeat protein